MMALQPPVPNFIITTPLFYKSSGGLSDRRTLQLFPDQTTDTLPLLTFRKISREITVLTVRMEASAAAVPKLFRTTSV